jgi:stage II sporulation protein AB (anti-sigma F factor)
VLAGLASFRRSYPATDDAVPSARWDAAAFAADHGATEAQLEAVRIAVSEAVANAVLHAYPDGGGSVHVTVAVAAGELWVLVWDDGCGFQAPPHRPGLGWGLALMAHHSEDLVIAERAGGGTEVRMRFGLGNRSAGPG